MEGVPAEQIGWGEVTYDLKGVLSVHEAIEWAERTLSSSDGPFSRGGTPVRDREYVLFARVPNEERFIQIAGWNPTVNAPATPPFNLLRRHPAPPGRSGVCNGTLGQAMLLRCRVSEVLRPMAARAL